jgi:hypothetical protein
MNDERENLETFGSRRGLVMTEDLKARIDLVISRTRSRAKSTNNQIVIISVKIIPYMKRRHI